MGGFDMGGHVIRPFGAMDQVIHLRIVSIRDKAFEPRQEVRLHIRIGIFLDQKRARRVAHETGQKPITTTLHEPRYLIGDFRQRPPMRLDRQFSNRHCVSL